MEKSNRSQGSASSFEAESQDLHLQSKLRTIRVIDSARVGTTALALLMGLTVLGVSANTLRVYQETHVSPDFLLPLWPAEFNIRPTVALVIGSAVVLVSNIVALCCSQVRTLRARATVHTSVTFIAPLLGLAGALISIIFYYAVNASQTVDTFLSWTCRWTDIPMSQQPRWDTLCRQSHAGLYLAILLIPVEVAALVLAGFQMKIERYTDAYLRARKTPVLS
ncbi:02660985-ca9f-4cab-8d24-284cf06b8608 [Thermothielavioides terrestris]|uniref:MARVEL domain-containing protein n=2 Tax=Thermothielavioides terrestris TaxID=2587410 RepID=G2RBQ7_THETT|nr:uncharacterized protein THITE_60015 [Thermothielavioides terrestris NRRL 8126]AEO69228.1 hypothetical protein THITE_60015 [Thermothielavioides terrestris NRRL 8126]SPQ22494.1 02660985-ca9f-4cab-8d24-284cf06b8608 [Thermothielavioides terrestris]